MSLHWEFYANSIPETTYKTVPIREKDVKFSTRILDEVLGTPNCEVHEFNRLKDIPLYSDT